MSLVESYSVELDDLEQYPSVLPFCEPSMPRVVISDFESQKKPLVFYDQNNSDFTEGLEPVAAPTDWLGNFEFAAAKYISSKLKHKLFTEDGLKIWSISDESRPELGEVAAFDEGVLAYLLAAWYSRSLETDSATEESIAVLNGQLLWVPKWYPLKNNFGSFIFDLVLTKCEVLSLLERLRESVHNFWQTPEANEWRKGSALGELFSSFVGRPRRLPKHVACLQLSGIECSTLQMRRRQISTPSENVFAPNEVAVLNFNALLNIEKRVMFDVSPSKMDKENE